MIPCIAYLRCLEAGLPYGGGGRGRRAGDSFGLWGRSPVTFISFMAEAETPFAAGRLGLACKRNVPQSGVQACPHRVRLHGSSLAESAVISQPTITIILHAGF